MVLDSQKWQPSRPAELFGTSSQRKKTAISKIAPAASIAATAGIASAEIATTTGIASASIIAAEISAAASPGAVVAKAAAPIVLGFSLLIEVAAFRGVIGVLPIGCC